jgi:hypothetical protein
VLWLACREGAYLGDYRGCRRKVCMIAAAARYETGKNASVSLLEKVYFVSSLGIKHTEGLFVYVGFNPAGIINV